MGFTLLTLLLLGAIAIERAIVTGPIYLSHLWHFPGWFAWGTVLLVMAWLLGE